MKTLPTALAAHLDQELTTLAYLLTITRTDGVVLRLTTLDQNLVVDGQTYLADAGFSAQANEQTNGLNVDQLELVGLLSSNQLSAADLASGKYDGAQLRFAVMNWADPSHPPVILRAGQWGEVSQSGQGFVAELRGLHAPLQQEIGEIMTPDCRHLLGNVACGVNLAALQVTGSVTQLVDQRQFIDSARSEADQYFAFGQLTWLTGSNAGQAHEVISFTAATRQLELYLPMSMPIQLGDAYQLVPGCDKRAATCKARFNNLINFGGFPHLPGLDALLQYPDAR